MKEVIEFESDWKREREKTNTKFIKPDLIISRVFSLLNGRIVIWLYCCFR